MILATLVTSPLGMAIVVALAVLVIFTCATLYALRVIRSAYGAVRSAEIRAQRRARARRETLAGQVFHEAGQAGRPDCPECEGDGGWLQLHPLPWGRQVEIQSALGLELPEGMVLPCFVRCASCSAPPEPAPRAWMGLGPDVVGLDLRPLEPDAPELPAFPSAPRGAGA